MKASKIMVIIFILCIIAGVIYFMFQNQSEGEAENVNVTYETVNMVTNLRLGITEFDSINPYLTKNRDIIYLNSLIYEPLLTITKDYNLQNCLAKEWSKINEKSYVVKLKENVKWSDGSNLTANDVEFSIKTLKDLKDSIYYENVKQIKQVEVIDKNTIRIELDNEIPFFEYNLIFPILSKKQYENNEKTPIGTGQYKINNVEKEQIELSKNNNWREKETQNANIKTIIIKKYETMGDVYKAFKNGNIDLLFTNNNKIEDYIGSIGYGKKEFAGREFDFIALNCENNILQFKEVRKAISLTINQNKIVNTILEGKAYSAITLLEPENYLMSKINISVNQNLEQAKQILEDAGWKYEYGLWQKEIDGITRTINLNLAVNKSNEQRLLVAEEIKNQLEQIGIKVTIQEISDNTYNLFLKNHNYEMLLTGVYTSLSPDLSYYFAENNLANYKNEEVKNILNDVYSITEEELLKEKYEKLMEIYFEEVPYIGLYRNKNMLAYNGSFRGELSPNNYNIYYNFSEWYRE